MIEIFIKGFLVITNNREYGDQETISMMQLLNHSPGEVKTGIHSKYESKLSGCCI